MFPIENLHLGVKVHFPPAIVVDRLCCWNDLYCSVFPKSREKSCRAGCWGILQWSYKAPGRDKGIFSNWKRNQFGGEKIPYKSWDFFFVFFLFVILG